MAAAPEPTHAVIRPMRGDELDAAHAVESAAYAFPWSRRIFADCLRVGYVCRVVEFADRLVGHAILNVVLDEAHLLNLCVAPECHRRGMGRRLLRHVLACCERRGCSRIILEVRPSNWRAIRVYYSEGFSVIGRRPGYYRSVVADRAGVREDALVLTRNIGSMAGAGTG